MTRQPVYSDPTLKHQPLSLIGELTKLPPRPAHVPAEDQLTAALAWLADRSDPFVRALCELVLDHSDEEAREALAGATMLGADVQVRFPSIGAGFLRADLSRRLTLPWAAEGSGSRPPPLRPPELNRWRALPSWRRRPAQRLPTRSAAGRKSIVVRLAFAVL
jgi:hypothetical protein